MRLARQWKTFAQARPGHRFQDRYRAQHRPGAEGGLLRRILHLALATVCAAIGVVLAFIPGPAVLFFLLAGALLASDWLWVARLLDWLEVKLRAIGRRARGRWRRLSVAARAALIALGGCLTAATTYGAYRLML